MEAFRGRGGNFSILGKSYQAQELGSQGNGACAHHFQPGLRNEASKVEDKGGQINHVAFWVQWQASPV